VGTAAVQIAKRFGCRVLGTVGSDVKLGRLRELGVDRVVNSRREDFEDAVREETGGRGVDVVLETVGGEVFRKSRRSLAPFGRIVCAGFASLNLRRWNPLSWWRTWRDLPRADIRDLSVASQGILSSHVGYLLDRPDVIARVWRDLRDFVTTHGIRPVVGHVLPLGEIAAAHALMESRESVGKVVLVVRG
jgi:NADPH:quinone reductase